MKLWQTNSEGGQLHAVPQIKRKENTLNMTVNF
jgi:hypothetical protein